MMLRGEPELRTAIGKTHIISPITVEEFCEQFRQTVHVFICAQSGGLFCGQIKNLKANADLIDSVYRKKAEKIYYNKLCELRRLEAIRDIDAEIKKAEIWMQQLEIDLYEARKDTKARNSKKEIESIEFSIRKVSSRIKMLKNAPGKIETLKAYKATHSEPDYQKPILKLTTCEYRSRSLPGEPPMWMVVTDSNQEGDVWLLSEMPDLIGRYSNEYQSDGQQ